MESWTLLILYATLGTGHCMAMCGGFATLATSGGNSPAGMFARLGLYLLGKTLTYLFLVLALSTLSGWLTEFVHIQDLGQIVGIVSGGAMVGFGVWQGYRFFRSRKLKQPYRNPGEDACRVNGRLRWMKNPFSAFFLGWVNGFLPCGFLWLALVYLSQWSNPGDQILGVLVFALLTSPGLLVAVGLFRYLKGKWVRWSLPVSACALVLYGSVLLLNATASLPHSIHQALVPISLPGMQGGQEVPCEHGCCTPQNP